jgi:hypothetical protein
MRVRWVAAGVVALLVPMVNPSASRSDGVAAAVPANCQPGRPAVAFVAATGTLVTPRAASPPIPCGGSTGFAAHESRIAASGKGLVFSPATGPTGPTAIAFSQDAGQHWRVAGPTGANDDNLYVDARTGRVFWIIFNADSANPQQHGIAYSDDGGATWTMSKTGACCAEGENSRAMTGARRTSVAQSGYPNVVYVCSNSSLVGGIGYPAGARVCSKSLDGGATFTVAGVLFSKPVAQHVECAPYGGDYFAASDGAYPQAGPNGALYVLVHCGTDHVAVTYLARSDDEAATWQILGGPSCGRGTGPVVVPNADELRVDAAGNLYAGWTKTTPLTTPARYDDTPMLQISRDGGCTWTSPMRMAPPGVIANSHHPENNAFQTGVASPYWPQPFTSYSWFMDAREPGHVAFALYGASDQSDRHWDAYIVESRNALDPNPTFWAAPVNDPAAKNMRSGARADEDSYGNEHVGLSIGPDGSAWGSFTDGTNGFAGRLLWPAQSAPASRPDGVHVAAAAQRRPGSLPATGGDELLAGLGLSFAAAGFFARRRLNRLHDRPRR